MHQLLNHTRSNQTATSLDPSRYDEEHVEQEAQKEERDREAFTRWHLHGPDGKTYTTHYHDDAFLIANMERVAKRLAATTTAPTKIVVGHDGSKRTVPTRIGKDLIDLCGRFDPALPTRHRHHVFNPWINAMLVALLHWCGFQGFCEPFPNIGIVAEDCDALNRITRFVRKACASRAFKAKLQGELESARKNFDSACAYVTSLFGRCSRLLILRIDLYYCGEGKEWARTDDAAEAFDAFLDNLRRSRMVPDVLGCLVRCEEGPERGIHFHVLVALDGHKRRDAYGLTEAIGKAWANRCSKSRGSYFNCYTRRHEYRFNGLGLVHLSDWRKLIGLRVALRYMTKPEYQIKDKKKREDRNTGKRGRKNFRRGLMRHGGVKRGAPRLPGHEMSTVLAILGPDGNGRRQR